MRDRKLHILFFIMLVAAIVALRFSLKDTLTVEYLKLYRSSLVSAVNSNYLLSVLTFIGSYITIAALAMPGAFILTLAGGFLFGPLPTALYVNISAAIGASIAFLTSRYLLGNWLQGRYGERLASFNDEVDRNGARYLISMRLVPAFPFFLINVLSGFTRLPFRTFVWTTSVGIIPGSLVFAFAGSQIGGIDSISEVLTPRVLAAFGALALFALFPVLLERIRKARNSAS